MALVAAPATVSEQLLARADRPGRIRDAGLRAWEAVRARPSQARAEVARVVRESRGLHSAERRLVGDVVFALVRDAPALEELLGASDPDEVWTAELVLRGLDRTDAPWVGFADRWGRRGDDRAPDARLALRHGVPVSAVVSLRRVLGDETEQFLVAGDQRAPVAVRANRARCTREQLARRLDAEGLPSSPSDLAPDGLVLAGRPHLPSSKVFRDGWLEVMDEGSQRIALLAAGEGLVIDACAGAGGKTLALATGDRPILALDVRQRALDELTRRAARAGVAVTTRLVAPEGPLPPDLPRAPTVLVDAPCSGSGVLRRNPAQRWSLDEGSVAHHQQRQIAILDRMSALVEAGGTLVYATCSVFREENEDVVAAFQSAHRGWSIRTAERWWPHLHGTDGFYGAVLDAPRA